MKLTDFPTVKKYLVRIGAEERSLLKAVVREEVGSYWNDICVIRFTRTGDVTAPEGFMPTESEALRIKDELSSASWPEQIHINMKDKNLPALGGEVFEFKDTAGNITMLQVRKQQKGKKSYIPITKWSDGEYRYLEPENDLPLYGLENLKDNTTVFIHEGASAARAGAAIADGTKAHPWATELAHAAHLGFIGGALSPERTDWSVLAKNGITRVYIVSDNDAPGISSVPKISKALNCPTFSIQFNSDFPVSFDLADPVPESMFKKIGEERFYRGPSFRDCLHPATYLTNLYTFINDKGKPQTVPVLRHHAKQEWIYVEETDQWVNSEFPSLIRKTEILDKRLVCFADTKKVSDLFFASYTGNISGLCYRPDKTGRIVSHNGTTSVNLYEPSKTKAQKGDIRPFFDFVEYLIPDEKDRHEVLRWSATLIGKPDIRFLFGMLLISNTQGTGKTTLCERILAPLVGIHNTTFPSNDEITSSGFNGWMAQKRLAVVSEIYGGASWKTANRIKGYVTDLHINVNPKFGHTYKIENWTHWCASSNDFSALRIDPSDRRWFIPKITEKKWTRDQFEAFYNWLDSGGLSIIKYWAENIWTDFLFRGEEAPMSKNKAEMIEDSRSEAQDAVADLAKLMNESSEPISVGFTTIKHWLLTVVPEKFYDSDHDLKKTMREKGVVFSEKRVSVRSRMQLLAMNSALVDRLREHNDKQKKVAWAKEALRLPVEIMGDVL